MPTSKNTNCHFNDRTINRENVRLIYFDRSESPSEIPSKLLEINPAALFYTDAQLCTNVLQSITNEEILLILFNVASADILSSVHSLPTILAIFIYDEQNERQIDNWRSLYPTVVDVCANSDDLLRSIEEKVRWAEDQTFVYHLLDPRRQDLTKESAPFLWHRMLVDVLKQIPSNELKRDELFSKCSQYYRRNRTVVDQIESFRRTYTGDQAIRWFSANDFLQALLKRALRTEDVDSLYSFRFFILDLSLAIEQDYSRMRKQEEIVIYRGQMMSRLEIDTLKEHLGCLISIDGFFFASFDKNIAHNTLRRQFMSKECVLFEMRLDLSTENVLCADVSHLREREILLQINALFKIDAVDYDAMQNLWEIKLTASNDGAKQVDEYLKGMMQKETDDPTTMTYFGRLLWKDLGQPNQAKTFFHALLKSLPKDHADIPDVYAELGSIYDQLGEHNLALTKYQYAWNIRQKQVHTDHARTGLVLSYIGDVYRHMGNIDRAIDFYGQALYIYETKCAKNKNQLQRASTIANLGLAYREKNDFDTALTYLTLAYDLRVDRLPKEHPLLAASLNSIGNLHHDKNNYDQALSYYQQALAIQDIAYSNDHLHKATTLRKIGLVYRDQQDWSNALSYFNRTLDIRQRLLPSLNHPEIAICYGDLGYVYEKTNQLDLALNNYQRELQIEEQCLPFDHPNLMTHFDTVIRVLKEADQSDKALELCQEKLAGLKLLLGNDYAQHPRVARILVAVATIYEDRNPKQADQHYQQAFAMLENKKNEAILQTCLSPMTNFYWKCRMFDRALVCQMKLLNLRRSTLSSNHNDIAYALRGLARLYRAMNKPKDALHYFNQSLNILQANWGPEHADVKNIRQEIFDLKDVVHSTSASTNDDVSEGHVSDIQKPPIAPAPSLAPLALDRKISSPKPISKSVLCALI